MHASVDVDAEETKTSVKQQTSVKPDLAGNNLQSLLNFEVPKASISEYETMFGEIANAYLNHTVLEVRSSGSASSSYFRVSEIEFYLNDYKVHKDTFTHGSSM